MTTAEYQKLMDEAEKIAELIASTEENYKGHMLIEIGEQLISKSHRFLGELLIRAGQEYNRT